MAEVAKGLPGLARVLVQREHRTEPRGNIVAFHVLGEQVPIRVPKLLATRYKLYMSTLAPTIPIAALHGREQPLGHALVRRCTTSSVKPTAFSFILDLGDHFRHNAFGFCDGLPTGGWCRAGNRLAENGRQGFGFRDAVFPQQRRNGGSILFTNTHQIDVLLGSQPHFKAVFLDNALQTGPNHQNP